MKIKDFINLEETSRYWNLVASRSSVISEEGVGKIIKGVNTTIDVKPGETQRQAAKFGNKVDSNGRPPELNKKIRKNSNANTAFNLGFTGDSND